MTSKVCGDNLRYVEKRAPRSRLGVCYLLGATAAISGCLDRPIATTNPETQSIFVKRNETTKIDKIDVLFMIDNSASMADKQAVLSAAVPQLLRRLTTPYCVDPQNPEAEPEVTENPQMPCAHAGYVREFSPVNDIHIGIVTSSLGDYGGDACPLQENEKNGTTGEVVAVPVPARNDHGWLLGSLPRTEGKLESFLSWTAQDAQQYPTQIQKKEDAFRSYVTAAGENGCGLEMSLESWYRFLVDPNPPKTVTLVTADGKTGQTQRSAEIDNDLLAQRAAFLRPDSLLAVVMLSDENDCSLKDSGASFWLSKRQYANGSSVYPKGAAGICATDPNSPCCYSCDLDTPPAGCPADPQCIAPDSATKSTIALKCFEQKRRYGYDFLFPTSRYVNALKLPWICPQNSDLDCECKDGSAAGCTPVPESERLRNPLYPDPAAVASGVQPRTKPDMVFLTGIVGVPWQDIAADSSLLPAQPGQPEPSLKYLPSSKIDWSLLLPTSAAVPARDPLMREQVEPRSGTHPITHEPIGVAAAPGKVNQINFHEKNLPASNPDLQFACVFDLSQPMSDTVNPNGLPGAARDCKGQGNACACNAATDEGNKSPLCLNPQTNQYGSIQYAAKAYPGLRQLEVLKGHNATATDNSIVASICPKDLNWEHRQQPGYGYNPALASLVERLKTKLVDNCLSRALVPDSNDAVPCQIIEATTAAEWSNCELKGRVVVDMDIDRAVRRQMFSDKICKDETCAGYSLCKLPQFTRDQAQLLNACQNTPDFETQSPSPGYCYVDPDSGFGSPDIVSTCPTGQKRKIRIVGNGSELRAPAPGWTYIACAGASYDGAKAANVATTAVK